MRLLNGKDLANYIKQQQASRVRSLRQTSNITPRLAIVATDLNNPVIDVYMRLKKKYGEDILVEVDVHREDQTRTEELLNSLNKDETVQAIIVQLPLADPIQTDNILNLVDPNKDVDGLSKKSVFEPATALAIMWLLAGYNINFTGKNVVLVGHGKLVGEPLEKLMISSGVSPVVIDINTLDPKKIALEADILVSATGVAGLITPDMIKQGAVVVDAGVASEGGKTIGDVATEVYEQRDDITITPVKGGVGPLTVCALFDNVIRASEMIVKQQKK
jgi:methylenetetrahydrofolate dehydrogenase (NADP+)/methenyltetrahydrofolate cyclohydrolase